ncbi:hypothetical protein [Tenacibaculum maritimum]|uniref:hypothetical protein n=1 Tax=Tenacibaculum maritimum TaxID=107401 RepID=UPI0012E486FB|nr:hypothetical protein [Tenacibaculum maritimum]CAA0141688.1 conserved hypothetical protein [Tenacibaculum maritimum]CAA0141712.1 conserved hypothetical protein [Tenacibaculum maritimum]CAA0141714.1 conserved hypothetical protein [Tenacibaculum maritimum]CAA0147789.1 conserved hypothetical protein [Tenacibaculum maritimum]CAA0187885.1 conserved hypothetical protein [Tenacibaculum maritimum]
MELANIEKLIEKYLNGETTLEEETVLKNYFLSEEVAPHLQEYQVLFEYFKVSKEEFCEKEIQLKPNESKKKNWKWLSIAASITLLFSIYMGNNYYQQRKIEKQFGQVKEALEMLSVNLKKSDEAIVSLYTYENTVNKIFETK